MLLIEIIAFSSSLVKMELLNGIYFTERIDESITSQSRALGGMNKLTKITENFI